MIMSNSMSENADSNLNNNAAIEEINKYLLNTDDEKYLLRLYVAGKSKRSLRAIETIQEIIAEHLEGRCELEIVDIYQHPEVLEKEQIIAIPTLVKKLPPPLQKFVGDMADTEKLIVGLDIQYLRGKKK
jgi:circadian clock protein KaiB